MAAHSYWRVRSLQTYGATQIEISELHLYGGLSRLDGAATLTASVAPSVGALASLSDADTATAALWAAADVPGLVLSWDFGGGSADVSHVLLGGAASVERFVLSLALQWSDDGVSWTTQEVISGIEWPGVRGMQITYPLAGRWSRIDRGSPSYVTPDQYTAGTYAVRNIRAVLGASSGIRQFELERVDSTGETIYWGVARAAASMNIALGATADSWILSSGTGNKLNNAVTAAYASSAGLSTAGVVIGVTVNFSTGAITFFRNGVSLGVAYTDGSIVGSVLYPVTGRGGDGLNVATKLRMSGFAYPIAGASDWAEGYTTPRALATAFPLSIGRADTLAYSGPASVQALPHPVPVREDFMTGVLGRGIGRVQGTTKDKGSPNVPVSERVRLYREQDGLLIRETWSQAGTGAYSFDYVDELLAYTVISYDHDKAFRAVVADNLTLAGGGVELIA